MLEFGENITRREHHAQRQRGRDDERASLRASLTLSFPNCEWGLSMPNIVEDLQMLRLIKAFQKVTDPDARRTIVIFVEEQVQKQGAKKREDHMSGPA